MRKVTISRNRQPHPSPTIKPYLVTDETGKEITGIVRFTRAAGEAISVGFATLHVPTGVTFGKTRTFLYFEDGRREEVECTHADEPNEASPNPPKPAT